MASFLVKLWKSEEKRLPGAGVVVYALGVASTHRGEGGGFCSLSWVELVVWARGEWESQLLESPAQGALTRRQGRAWGQPASQRGGSSRREYPSPSASAEGPPGDPLLVLYSPQENNDLEQSPENYCSFHMCLLSCILDRLYWAWPGSSYIHYRQAWGGETQQADEIPLN